MGHEMWWHLNSPRVFTQILSWPEHSPRSHSSMSESFMFLTVLRSESSSRNIPKHRSGVILILWHETEPPSIIRDTRLSRCTHWYRVSHTHSRPKPSFSGFEIAYLQQKIIPWQVLPSAWMVYPGGQRHLYEPGVLMHPPMHRSVPKIKDQFLPFSFYLFINQLLPLPVHALHSSISWQRSPSEERANPRSQMHW